MLVKIFHYVRKKSKAKEMQQSYIWLKIHQKLGLGYFSQL